jgi:hypothetical protein
MVPEALPQTKAPEVVAASAEASAVLEVHPVQSPAGAFPGAHRHKATPESVPRRRCLEWSDRNTGVGAEAPLLAAHRGALAGQAVEPREDGSVVEGLPAETESIELGD